MKDYIGGVQPPRNSIPDENPGEIDRSALYLRDLSDKDKAWDKHRSSSDKVANHYRGTEEYGKYAARIDFCAQLLEFRQVEDENEYKLKLDGARFCRVRHCPVCQWRRSLMWKAKAYKILPTVTKKYSNCRWLFLTLTVKNCQITKLRNTLQWMNYSWQRMVQRKKFPAIGWIRSTEVSKGKNRSAHPHFHALLLVKPSYFGRNYMKQDEWIELWRSCLRINYKPILDIRSIKSGCELVEVIPEILKYCVKESDLVMDREWFLELTDQMYKVRTVATGGVLKKYLRQLEEEPEDLIGRDESKIEGEVSEGSLYFSWKGNIKRYKFLEPEI